MIYSRDIGIEFSIEKYEIRWIKENVKQKKESN